MASNLVKESYSVNKQQYVSYHIQIASAFQKDCDRLLVTFESEVDLSFKMFASLWRDMHFSYIFNDIELVEELRFFIESCFTTIQKYLVFCERIGVKVGAFYMLYCLYWRQPTKNKIRIRCTAEVFRHISNLVDRMYEEGAYDVPYLFQQLKFDDAFKLVIFSNVYALEGRFMWQEKELQNDIFKEIKRGDPLLQTETVLHSQEFYGLNNICTVASDYVEGLRKYGISEKVCEAVTNLPGELKAILNQMDSCEEGSESNVTESKAKQLKGKAFTSKCDFFRK